jgi:hypothetical protein
LSSLPLAPDARHLPRPARFQRTEPGYDGAAEHLKERLLPGIARGGGSEGVPFTLTANIDAAFDSTATTSVVSPLISMNSRTQERFDGATFRSGSPAKFAIRPFLRHRAMSANVPSLETICRAFSRLQGAGAN